MKKEPFKRIKFDNKQCPSSQFDIRTLSEAFTHEKFHHLLESFHLIDFYLIILITEGKGIHTIDFVDFNYNKGTVFTIRKDQIHRYHIAPATEGYMILFTEQFVQVCFDENEGQKVTWLFNELLSSPKIQLSTHELNDASTLVKDIIQEYFNRQDEHTFSIIRSELQILIAKLSRKKSRKHSIKTKQKYFETFLLFQTLVEKSVTKSAKVNYYAHKMGFSTKTLNNVTQSIINKSAKVFIDEIYINKIKRLLLNTQYPIKEIAYQVGFEEVTNFYKYFKKHTGQTPEKFREKFQ